VAEVETVIRHVASERMAAYRHGLRFSELVNLPGSAIDLDAG